MNLTRIREIVNDARIEIRNQLTYLIPIGAVHSGLYEKVDEIMGELERALSGQVTRLIAVALEMQAEWDASLDDEGDSMCLPNSPKHAPTVADVRARFEAERKQGRRK